MNEFHGEFRKEQDDGTGEREISDAHAAYQARGYVTIDEYIAQRREKAYTHALKLT